MQYKDVDDWIPVPDLEGVEWSEKIRKYYDKTDNVITNGAGIAAKLKAREIKYDLKKFQDSLKNQRIGNSQDGYNAQSDQELEEDNEEPEEDDTEEDENQEIRITKKELKELIQKYSGKKPPSDQEVTEEQIEEQVAAKQIEINVRLLLQILEETDLKTIWRRTRMYFPPEWGFHVWLAFLVRKGLEEFQIGITVWQDREALPENIREMCRAAMKDWSLSIEEEKQMKKDAEKHLEKGTRMQ